MGRRDRPRLDATLRVLDASANRAGEAMRVLEDLARFATDDASVAERLKALRHELREACDALMPDPIARLDARDVEGDVGRLTRGSGEYERRHLHDVAMAATQRLAESLRTLEEVAKTIDPHTAERFERMRYQAYTIQPDLIGGLRHESPQWRLCVLITESLCRKPWQDVALAAMDGGADCLQLREKNLDDRALLQRAAWLTSEASRRGVDVVVNDRVDIALLSDADAAHLGPTDLDVASARRVAQGRLLVGVSTSSLEAAHAAVAAGADTIGVGAMYASTTKRKPSIAGPALLRAVLDDPVLAGVPHLAIGGITPERAAELAAIGCRGVAVSSCVCDAKDPAGACRALLDALGPVDSPHAD